ncbi:MAG TPA: helix-turn-helix domain-containing protein [Bacteroidota bacterium]|nr:helix-turn-helix domain-containing protein [Bacteroidota bacterium]
MDQEILHDRQRRILEAARKRFAHYGFSKVTMDEIASDVGLAKPSLYYYYPAKENLFRAVIGQEQATFLHEVTLTLKKKSPASVKLREYVALRVRLFRELVNLSALSVQSWKEVSALFLDLFRSLEEQELKFLHIILLEGKNSGEIDLPNPLSSARLLLHVLHGLRLRMFHKDREERIDDEAYAELKKESDQLIEMLLHGMRRTHEP